MVCIACVFVSRRSWQIAAALPPMQREPLRLHKNWAMALLFFAMWDALLVALVWWSCHHWGSPAVFQYQVRPAVCAAHQTTAAMWGLAAGACLG